MQNWLRSLRTKRNLRRFVRMARSMVAYGETASFSRVRVDGRVVVQAMSVLKQ